MINEITTTGLVASTPRHVVTAEGLHITSFRLLSSRRHWNAAAGKWEGDGSNWYVVSCLGQIGLNAFESLQKGARVFVTGELRLRDWDNSGAFGTTAEINAEAIGHDLNFCITSARPSYVAPEAITN